MSSEVNNQVINEDSLPNKVPLLLMAFFVGNFGIHRFYLKDYKLGIVYLLFAWTNIPALIALGEMIYFSFKSEEKIRESHPEKSGVRIMLLVGIIAFIYFWFIFIMRILPIKETSGI